MSRHPRSTGARIAALLALLLVVHSSTGWRPAGSALPVWEVKHAGGTLHLLASVHLVRPSAYPLDARLYGIFDRARIVAFELDLGREDEISAALLRLGMYGDSRTLRDGVPAELYADLARRLGGIGVPVQALDGMKPWLAALTVTGALMRSAGLSGEGGIDMHLHRRALEAGKRIVGFETAAEQFDIFDGLDSAAQVELLRHTLDSFDSAVAVLDSIMSHWRNGEMEAVAALLAAATPGQPVLLERLIHRRNRNWIPAIEALIASGEPTVVVVGAGHLVGDGSVVELLRERGYDVAQVGGASRHSLMPQRGRCAGRRQVCPAS